MIQTQTQLDDFLNLIKSETELAIDTEFNRVNTYHPILCLVQISTNKHTDCIDILAVRDLNPLFEKLYHPDSVWIAHASRQDIEALYCLSKRLPKQLFDTQIAAALLKFPMQVSYQALTKTLQNVLLKKAYTRLDWRTRPLPDEAIEYALDDVRYLLKNFKKLKQQLTAEGKLSWIEEEAAALLNSNLYKNNIENAWQTVKGFSQLTKDEQTFAAQLAAWREAQAKQKNKPRKWLISDEKLINYALKKYPLPAKSQTALTKFLSTHPQLNAIKIVSKKNTPPTNQEKLAKNKLQKLIQKIATQYNLNEQIITNSKSLLKYIRGDRSVNFLKGWRFDLLKEALNHAK